MRSFLRTTTILIVLFVSAPVAVFGDTLYLSPSSGSYVAGKTFAVQVYVSSLSQEINAVSGVISYPQDKLQVVSVSKAGSILNTWPENPSFSNVTGKINFEGAIFGTDPYKGAGGNILTINFRTTGQGGVTVKFDSGSILAQDGYATNILKNVGSAFFTLGGSPIPAAVDTNEAQQEVDDTDPNTPKAPVVTSDDFPDVKSWYSKTAGTFKWGLPDDVTATRLLLGKLSRATPTVVYSPAIGFKEISDLEDGTWYLHVQFKHSSCWGSVTHRPIKVDTTKPDSFVIKPLPIIDQTNPKPRFAFTATDGMSGIHHYSIQINGADAIEWRDDGSGVYETPALKPGKHTIVARAYDEADNYAVASVDFNVTSIEIPTIESYTQSISSDVPLSVSGKALPDSTVLITLRNNDNDSIVFSVKADSLGKFSTLYDKEIPRGAYRMTAVTQDKRGAQSDPSTEKIVTSRAAWLTALGSTIVNTLAIIVPIAALAFWIIFMAVRLVHKITRFRKNVRRELREIESTIEKAFDLLKEDVEDSIHLLEHAKSKRRLTEEEDKIIQRFRQNLLTAEKVIKKEIRDVEREIGDR